MSNTGPWSQASPSKNQDLRMSKLDLGASHFAAEMGHGGDGHEAPMHGELHSETSLRIS